MKRNRLTKLLSMLLVSLLLLSLAACNAPAQTNPDPTPAPSSAPGSSGTPAPPAVETPASTGDESRYGGVLDLVWDAASDTVDPHYSTGWNSYFWSQNVFETALSRDAEGNFQPMVCEYELSDDGLTLKMWVREGITFHNGDAVTIEDVVASLSRSGSLVANVGKFFTDYVETVDIADGVVTYTFNKYAPNTLYYISGHQNWSAIMPASICEKYGENPITDVNDCIGTGVYYLDEYAANVKFGLKRYEGYVPIETDATGMASTRKGYMDAINIWINSENTSSTMALFNGEYDAFADVEPEYYETAQAQYGLAMAADPTRNNIYLAFNTKGERPVNDPNLRKAIAAALDYEELAKAEFGENYIMDSCPMAEGLYYNDVFNKTDYRGAANLELSKQYLDASSYNGEELILLVNPNTLSAASVVAESRLKAAGINAVLQYMDAASIRPFYEDPMNEYDMIFLVSAVNDFVPATLAANMRTTFWGSEKKDELFGTISSVMYGSDESVAAWKELADVWVDECSIVTIGQVIYIWMYDEDLVPNWDGSWRYFFNSYWSDPAAHMD